MLVASLPQLVPTVPFGAAGYTQGIASVSEVPRLYNVCLSELGITWEHPGAQGIIHLSTAFAGTGTGGATSPRL